MCVHLVQMGHGEGNGGQKTYSPMRYSSSTWYRMSGRPPHPRQKKGGVGEGDALGRGAGGREHDERWVTKGS